MAAIPIVTCGKNPPVVALVAKQMPPEYKVVSSYCTVEQLKSDLPKVIESLEGDEAPVAITVGGGFSAEELEEARSLPCRDRLVWFHHLAARPTGNPWDPAQFDTFAKSAAEQMKIGLASNGIVPGSDKVNELKGQLLHF